MAAEFTQLADLAHHPYGVMDTPVFMAPLIQAIEFI